MNGKCPSCGHVDPMEQARGIIAEVAEEHGVPVKDMCGSGKQAYLVAARKGAIRRIRAETDLYLRQIGALFGGLRYNTIIHHLNVDGREATDAAAATSRQAQS